MVCIDQTALWQAAQNMTARAYAPYSEFKVGAALLAASGQVYLGVNVENASYGLTCCAERVAVYNAVAAGEREFLAIAIANAKNDYTAPCGACRQVLQEFVREDFLWILGQTETGFITYKMIELLPHAFKLVP